MRQLKKGRMGMKALFIGGTGVISTEISKLLVQKGWDLTLLNRGTRASDVPGARQLTANIGDEKAVAELLKDETFDVVADFICFVPGQAERDIRLFSGKVRQFIFISSASAYQKPLSSPVITESTPLHNPYWQYSRDKAACEKIFMNAYRQQGFPVTVVRPSHTFSDRSLPVAIHGDKGPWQVLDRMMKGKTVPVPGDGSSLWAVMSSRDFAPAFVGLMGNIHAIGEAVQITSEELLTWNQIMEVVAGALGVTYKPCYVPSAILAKCSRYDYSGALLGDKSNTVIFDNAKLHRLVPGFQARYRFDESGPASVRYFLTHPEMQTPDPDFDAFCDGLEAAMARAEKEIAAL